MASQLAPPPRGRARGGAPTTGTFELAPAPAAAWADYGTVPHAAAEEPRAPTAVVVDGDTAAAALNWRAPAARRGSGGAAAAPPTPSAGSDGAGGEAASAAALLPRPAPAKPRRERPIPWVCIAIALGCAAGFSYELATTPGVIAPLSINPLVGPSSEGLIASGAKVTCLIEPPHNQWWRLLSPLWLHAGVVHIVVNMNMLRIMGVQLERAAGVPRFLGVYSAAGVLSMVGSAVFASSSVTVGASGALFGLLGAFLAELITNCHLLSLREGCCAFASIGLTIAVNLAIGLLPFVDNFAHLFGLIGGMCLGFALLIHVDDAGRVRARQICTAAVALLAYLFLLCGGVALLYFRVKGEDFCPSCKFISCVPSPWWSCDSAVPDLCAAGLA